MQTLTVSKSQFKAKALAYMRWVEHKQQTLIVTDMGNPVIEIKPHQPPATTDPYAMYRGSILKYDRPNDPLDLKDWGGLA